MLRLLPQRHRGVLIRRYGLNDSHVESHEEIGEWLGVGEERSRQLEREALRRLRSIAASLTGGVAVAGQPAGGAGVRPCRRMTSAIFAWSGGPPAAAASTSWTSWK